MLDGIPNGEVERVNAIVKIDEDETDHRTNNEPSKVDQLITINPKLKVAPICSFVQAVANEQELRHEIVA